MDLSGRLHFFHAKHIGLRHVVSPQRSSLLHSLHAIAIHRIALGSKQFKLVLQRLVSTEQLQDTKRSTGRLHEEIAGQKSSHTHQEDWPVRGGMEKREKVRQEHRDGCSACNPSQHPQPLHFFCSLGCGRFRFQRFCETHTNALKMVLQFGFCFFEKFDRVS